MPAGGDDAKPPYYGRARIAGGLALIAVAVILALIDAFSLEYALDSITFGLILGTGAVLLGAEAIRITRQGGE